MTEICRICGELKFEVFTQDGSYMRCLNCEKDLQDVIKANEKGESDD